MRSGEPPDDLSALQAEVQRGLGRCLLNLQLYEQALKALLSSSDIRTTPAADGRPISTAFIITEKMTLGGLVSSMLGTVLRPEGYDAPDDDDTGMDGASPSARLRFSISFPAETHAQLEAGLRELVTIRNALIHHFAMQHELNSHEGCRIAIAALDADRHRIITHLEDVRAWLDDMAAGRAQMSEALKNEETVKILAGQVISWPHTSIVQGLQEAERALGEGGWTSLSAGQAWMSDHHPEELPSNYDCRSWPHLLHETKLFDLRRPFGAKSSTLYRTRLRPQPPLS